MQDVVKINKSELKKISFAKNEVLDTFNQNKRDNLLIAAIGMKKDGTGKIEITFESLNRGKFKVISPILTAGKDYLVLKGGQTISIKSITNIRF